MVYRGVMLMPHAPVRSAGRREWLVLGVLTFAVILLAVDGTVLALAIPSLVADLNPTSSQVLWIGDIYSFLLAGLLVTMGNLADRVGRKRLLLVGVGGFGAVSVLAAFADSAGQLIVARALLGLFGSMIMPSTLSILRHVFEDPRQRTTAIAVWAAGITGGAAAGPLVGGALLERFWWGSVFLINVPVMLLVLVAGVVLLPESRSRRSGPIDLASAVLSVVAVVGVVYAVKHAAGSGLDWLVPAVGGLGVLAGVVFVLRQRRLTQPLVDTALFRIRAFTGAVAAETIAVFAFIGLLFFFSLYLQSVRGLSPLRAGLLELPATLAAMSVVAFAGPVMYRLGRGRSVALGLAVAAVGMVALAGAEAAPGYWLLCGALAICGLGAGLATTLATDAIVGAVPKDRAGAASSISETGYELGVALGIAVLGSIQTAVYRSRIDLPEGLSAELEYAARDSLASAEHATQLLGPAADPVLEAARHAFTDGMQIAALIAGGLLVVSAIIAWRTIPSPTGYQEHVNVHP